MALDFRDQYFGCEIEMTGLTRQQAARTLAELFGTSITHYGGTYDGYRVADREGKDWKIVSDGSINAFRRSNGRQVPAGREYRVEMNSPKLEYAEMEKLQEVVRALRHAGAFVNDSCGMHVHIDAARHTPKSLKNLLSIMYSKEDILFAALKVDESRTRRWCRRVEEPVLQTIRKLPKDASMEMLKSRWYQGNDGSNDHYDLSRYHAVNLHSVFYHGTVEFRLFNATLHAGEVKANIVLAMAISAQAINQQKTLAHKTPVGDNPAFTFRTFLLRLGLIGPEYKNVREHLLKNLPGGYRLAFRRTGGGYLTILPDKGNHVDGLLWKVSAQDEQALNHYEGFPHFYARRTVDVQGKGVGHQAMVYVMNAPYKDEPERPSRYYWNTVLEGCRQNGIPMQPMLEAWREAAQACRPQKHRDTFESPDR